MKNIAFFKLNACTFSIVLTIALLLGNLAVADDTSDSSTPKGSENGDSVVDTSVCDEKEGQLDRIALVVGINDYDGYQTEEGKPLESFDDGINGSPVTSAEKIAEVLNKVGFCVFKYLAKKQQEGETDTLLDVLSTFQRKIQNNSTVIFYFSGHAIFQSGVLGLLAKSIDKHNSKSISLNQVAGHLKIPQNDVPLGEKTQRILIIDACRNNEERDIGGTTGQASDDCTEDVNKDVNKDGIITQEEAPCLKDGTCMKEVVKKDNKEVEVIITRDEVTCLKKKVDTASQYDGPFTAYSVPPGVQAEPDGIYSEHLANLIKQPDLSLNELFSELGETVTREREEKKKEEEKEKKEGKNDGIKQPHIEAPLDTLNKFKQFHLGGKKPLKLILRF